MLIDERGRLFGKINVIDFIVLLFVLCLLPMFYFGYKIFTKPIVIKPPTIVLDNAKYEQIHRVLDNAKYEQIHRQRDYYKKAYYEVSTEIYNHCDERPRCRKDFPSWVGLQEQALRMEIERKELPRKEYQHAPGNAR